MKVKDIIRCVIYGVMPFRCIFVMMIFDLVCWPSDISSVDIIIVHGFLDKYLCNKNYIFALLVEPSTRKFPSDLNISLPYRGIYRMLDVLTKSIRFLFCHGVL